MNILSRILFSSLGGIGIFLLTAGSLTASHRYSYDDRVYPGVSVAGVDVTGLTEREVAEKLRAALTYPQTGRIAFQDGPTVWVATPFELGFVLDAASSTTGALEIGRSIDPLFALTSQFRPEPVDLAAHFIFDERVARGYLQQLANTIRVPTVEASLGLNGLEVVLHSGQIGREMDVPAALAALPDLLRSLKDGLIVLQVNESPPVIFDATLQAEIAREILSEPLVIRDPDSNPETPVEWVIEPDALAGMLSIERVIDEEGKEVYQVGIRTSELVPFLTGIAPGLGVSPVNARFIFNDDTRELDLLEPSTTGRELLVQATAERINQQLALGEHRIDLVFDYLLPAVTSDSTAEDLGITELVSSQTTYFYGSSASRLHNIRTASSRFHGILVPPGGTFSMAAVLGDISLDTGYAEALIIFGDRTIQGVGGGVCQVSTTLFRAVFFGGFQIDERYSHAYRVVYYEQASNGSINTNLAGLDATVFVPLVDFKFTNDTPHWLLMETYVTNSSLTWKFYSTSDGRTVEWTTTGLQDRVDPPKPHYEENPDLDKGEIKQVDWAVDGANVTVVRTVTREGQVIHEDVIVTRYQPWRAVYEYGPGTDIPDDDKDAW
ncbi:MAG TPA: VanW family protein [Anaerolineales bacterium]|nr:VanW family protein [Anaerolineales bacterium]